MRKYLLSLLFLVVLSFTPILSTAVKADYYDPNMGTISSSDKTKFDEMLNPLKRIFNFVKYGATIIGSVVLAVAGITYIISGSDPRQRQNSKNMAMYSIIGLVIIWGAPAIISYVV